MKKIPNWALITVVISLLIATKFIFLPKKEDKGANKSKNAIPVTANYFVLKSKPLANNLSLMGKVGSFNQVDILPEVNGKIIGLYFKEGEYVKAGTLLVKLNDADIQAQLVKVRSQIKLSELKFSRLKQLLQAKGVSQEEVDIQENELQVLKADESFNLAQLAKTNVVAPFNGMLGLKRVSNGTFVNANTPIVSLVEMNPLFIEFSLPQKYSALLQVGQKVDFKLDEDMGENDLNANIYAIEPVVDEATKSIHVRAIFNPIQNIHPGIFVMVNLKLKESANALMVPSQCIVPTLKGQKLYVYKNGAAIETPVKIGIRDDQMIQVLEGIQEGDTVLSTGLLGIKKDSKIKLIKASH
ncbi:MAG: efflux RND transporter periplasmic adaptor subunit [Bacteroidota bacterium]